MKPMGTEPFIAFEVIFKGEHVMGEGGPYRQFFADISKELREENSLNLLCPTANNLSKSGNGKDKYLINPSAKQTY